MCLLRQLKSIGTYLFLSFFCLLITTKAQAGLSELRFGRQGENAVRVVAHIDKKTDCRVFTLQNPNRIVIDFENTELEKVCQKNMPEPLLFIKQVRAGEPIPGQARVVLETDDLLSFDEGFFLAPTQKNGDWRFVLDLKKDSNNTSSVMLPLKPQAQKQPPARSSKVQKPLIVLDPGHGGADPGAISYSGKYEKNLTLNMAKETKAALEKTGKYRVLLTRSTDKALTLRGRMEFAHKNNADLFISIHADSAKNRKAKGLSVYTISEKASDREAMLLAERENKADIILGIDLTNELPEVSNILIDLAKRDTMDKSSHFANILVDEMARKVTLVKNAHRFAGFVVLKSANIPSVLLEMGYLSNRQEEKLLQQKSYRSKLAQSIVNAVNQYFNTIYE